MGCEKGFRKREVCNIKVSYLKFWILIPCTVTLGIVQNLAWEVKSWAQWQVQRHGNFTNNSTILDSSQTWYCKNWPLCTISDYYKILDKLISNWIEFLDKKISIRAQGNTNTCVKFVCWIPCVEHNFLRLYTYLLHLILNKIEI